MNCSASSLNAVAVALAELPVKQLKRISNYLACQWANKSSGIPTNGLVFEYVANLATIQTDGSGNVLFWNATAGSQPVQLISQLSGFSYPTYDPTGLNGHPSVDANLNSAMTAAINITGTQLTWACVVNWDCAGDTSQSGQNCRLAAFINQSLGNDDANSINTAAVWQDIAADPIFLEETRNSTGEVDVGGFATAPSVPSILIFRRNGTSVLLSIQPLGGAPLSNTATTPPDPYNGDTVTVFSNFVDSSTCSIANLSFFAGWERALSDAEITSLSSYLTSLYS